MRSFSGGFYFILLFFPIFLLDHLEKSVEGIRGGQDAKKSRYVLVALFPNCHFPLFRGHDYARGSTTTMDPWKEKKKGFAHLYRLYWAALRCAIPTCFCTPVSPPVQPIQPITHSKSPNATHMMPYPMLFAPPPQAWTPAPRRQNPRDPIYPRRLNQQPGKDGLSFAREGLMRSPPKRPIHYMLLYDP